MKTSNKLLAGLLLVILIIVIWIIGTAKYYATDKAENKQDNTEQYSPEN